MKSRFLTTALCVVIGSLGLLAACNSSTDASSGVSLSDFQALQQQVASLQQTVTQQGQEITALQSSSGSGAASGLYLTISAPNAHTASLSTMSVGGSSGGVHTDATGTTCTGLGTLTGHPNTSDPISSNVLSGYSCSGYLFNVTGSVTGGVSDIQPLASGIELDFTGTNCTGNVYVRNVPAAAIANGIVFAFNASGTIDYTNAANYYYVPAGQTAEQVTMLSFYNGSCQNITGGGTVLKGYPVSPNDPTVTDIDSAEIAGPVMAAKP